jgi:hypothetical protein
MLAPGQPLRYWREQQPSNQGGAGSISVRDVGAVFYTEVDQLQNTSLYRSM